MNAATLIFAACLVANVSGHDAASCDTPIIVAAQEHATGPVVVPTVKLRASDKAVTVRLSWRF